MNNIAITRIDAAMTKAIQPKGRTMKRRLTATVLLASLAMAQQRLDPAAGRNGTPANGLDGPSARAVMERYRASFVEPNGQVAQPVQFMLGGGNGK